MSGIAASVTHAVIAVGCCGIVCAAVPDLSRLDPDSRAAAVERQMTDEERIQLLHGVMAVPFPGLSPPPAGVKPTAGYVRGVPRLGIPDLLETDASLGVSNPFHSRPGDVATAMPSGLALSSSFDRELARLVGATIGAEVRAKGFNVLLGGGVNLARDPRSGRNFEYLGEDSLLAGSLGGAAIAGTQSQGVISTVKHYVLNDQETLRQSLDARIDEAALRESDLLAFEIAIEIGRPGSIMCAYNKVNGEYSCGNDWLLNGVLKKDWGYKGWVMSDWGAVRDLGFLSKGLDQESGEQLDAKVWFGAPLARELAAGSIPRRQVSGAVRRILRSIYAVGADRASAETSVDYDAHAVVAKKAAREGIVLLKNDGVLPITVPKRVLVIGGHADIGVLSGGGSSQVTPYGGSPTLIPVGGRGLLGPFSRQLFMPSPPLAALGRALPNSTVEFDSGYDADSAAAAATHFDMAIVFATQWQTEGVDHASMNLPQGQDALIAAVAKTNPNTIVVLETGNPVKMPWLHAVKAVLESWYPGQAGGVAIAEVLTGAVNPSGHLSISFPEDETQLPRPRIPGFGLKEYTDSAVDYTEGSTVGYQWYAAKQLHPLFPFGFGLSYTSFAVGDLTVQSEKTVTVRFSVQNTGDREGATVPQLYLVNAAGLAILRLVAFERVNVDAGAKRFVEAVVDPRLLAQWQTKSRRWVIKPGRYSFALGTSASELGMTTSVDLSRRELRP